MREARTADDPGDERAAACRTLMRVLALDYGSARCGCALSDPTGTLATPIAPVLRPATRKGMARLAALVREREVVQVVVGLPLGLSGNDTAQTAETRAFAERLGTVLGPEIPIDLYDERFTTRIAEQFGGRESEDSRAAAVLLEGWLARHASASPGGDHAAAGWEDMEEDGA